MWQCKRYPLHCHICVFLLDLNIPHFINESKKNVICFVFHTICTIFAVDIQSWSYYEQFWQCQILKNRLLETADA